MRLSHRTGRLPTKPHLWLIRFIGLIVPRRLRADWRQEWEAELRHRETLLAEWDKLNRQTKLDLLRRSLGAFWDALLLQPQRWEDEMIQDIRFGARMLWKQKSFTLVVLFLLALGIGANTALFSVVDAVLLKQLPVKAPEQLVLFSHTGRFDEGFSYDYYELIREPNAVTSGMLAYFPTRLTVDVGGQQEPAINGQLVSGNYFQVLGVSAALGRTIVPQDTSEGRDIGKEEAEAPSEQPVCVISHGYWQRRFARDPAIIGKTVHLSGHSFTIIGVTPPEFFGLEVGSSMDISVPLTMQQLVMPESRLFIDHNWERLRLMGRLRPGATMAQAQASLGLIYQRYNDDISADYSDAKGAWVRENKLQQRLLVASGSQGLSEVRQQFSQPLFVLLCVVTLVLLITCANVAGLLLARGVVRRKELAVRLTLGAGRWRLVRQLFTESLLLACLGSLFGLLLAWWGTQLLLPLLSQNEIPVYLNLKPDLRMLGFTAAVAVLTSLLAGLAPSLLASRVELQTALKQDAPGRSGRHALRFGRVFVIAQVALSLLLLIGAGLFVRSLQKLQQVEPGYARENVLVLKLEPLGSSAGEKSRITAFYDELLQRVKAMPGVTQASLVGFSPIIPREWMAESNRPTITSRNFFVEGVSLPPAEAMVSWMQIYPNSFAALGIPLTAGRDIGPQDVDGSQQVAVINESMA
ncbi:MAG TPA: ABC transporter permease, partial [Blastocatellia bacterium]|nr:ABC transporter permease [Blastocatellia bacterium]